jgi:hypothetical protein
MKMAILKPYHHHSGLWQSIQEHFQPPSIPTWSNGGADMNAKGWTASDYAMEICCSLPINLSKAFQSAHVTFDQLAQELFPEEVGHNSIETKCSFVTRSALIIKLTNTQIFIHVN